MRTALLSAPRQRGFSLIELMVSLAIGLVLTLAITVLLTRNEAGRRGLNSSNDMEQTGAYLALQLDRSLRSAGSSFTHRWSNAYGCQIRAARAGDDILPLAEALDAPFDDLPLAVRLAPVLIYPAAAGDGGDVLSIMAGAGGLSESTLTIQPKSVTDVQLRLPNTIGMRDGDIIALLHPSLGCMVEQVADGFAGSNTQVLSLGDPSQGDSYYSSSIDGLNLTDYAEANGPELLQLGNSVGSPPQFMWMGVGSNDTLLSYDLLQIGGSNKPQTMADGVMALHAVYGVDTNGDGTLDEWHSADEAGYAPDDLTDISNAANIQRLRSIVAVRVGLVLSSALVERDAVPAASSFTLFGDLGDLAIEVDLADRADKDTQVKRRHRVFEFTVPLRNALI